MRDYELMFIVRPDLDEEAINQAIEKVSQTIHLNGGEIAKINLWGKRRLAYEVEDYRDGYYVVSEFKLEPPRVLELERVLKLSDQVMRYLLLSPQRSAKAMRAKEKEKERERARRRTSAEAGEESEEREEEVATPGRAVAVAEEGEEAEAKEPAAHRPGKVVADDTSLVSG